MAVLSCVLLWWEAGYTNDALLHGLHNKTGAQNSQNSQLSRLSRDRSIVRTFRNICEGDIAQMSMSKALPA